MGNVACCQNNSNPDTFEVYEERVSNLPLQRFSATKVS